MTQCLRPFSRSCLICLQTFVKLVDMEPEDYKKHYWELNSERDSLIDARTNLETTLSEIKTRIAHLDEVLEHLSPLAGMSNGDDVAKLGITDAIRAVLQWAPVKMSAADVQRALAEKGFDLSGYTAPMASIYKILGRLVEDSKEVEREKDERSRVFFSWKRPEISDDDIPF